MGPDPRHDQQHDIGQGYGERDLQHSRWAAALCVNMHSYKFTDGRQWLQAPHVRSSGALSRVKLTFAVTVKEQNERESSPPYSLAMVRLVKAVSLKATRLVDDLKLRRLRNPTFFSS